MKRIIYKEKVIKILIEEQENMNHYHLFNEDPHEQNQSHQQNDFKQSRQFSLSDFIDSSQQLLQHHNSIVLKEKQHEKSSEIQKTQKIDYRAVTNVREEIELQNVQNIKIAIKNRQKQLELAKNVFDKQSNPQVRFQLLMALIKGKYKDCRIEQVEKIEKRHNNKITMEVQQEILSRYKEEKQNIMRVYEKMCGKASYGAIRGVIQQNKTKPIQKNKRN